MIEMLLMKLRPRRNKPELSEHQREELDQLREHFGRREMQGITFTNVHVELETYWDRLFAILRDRPYMAGIDPNTPEGREFMLEHWKMLNRHCIQDDDD